MEESNLINNNTQINNDESNQVDIDHLEGTMVSISSTTTTTTTNTIEAEESELLGKSVTSVEEAYQMYNECRIGFGVRYYKTRKRNNGVDVKEQEFSYNKEGLKEANEERKFTKKIGELIAKQDLFSDS